MKIYTGIWCEPVYCPALHQGRKIVYVVKWGNDTNDRRGSCIILMSELYFSHTALHLSIKARNLCLCVCLSVCASNI